MIDKEKVLNGVEKAVDFTNDTADKVGKYIKDNELDIKAKNAAIAAGKGIKEAGISAKDAIEKAYNSYKNK